MRRRASITLLIRRALWLALAGLLLAAMGAASAACKLVQVAEWKADLSHGPPLVDGAINGQPIRILIGTGSDRTFLYAAEARRLGLPLRQYSDRKEYTSTGATVQIESANVEELQIGTLRAGKLTLPVLDSGGPQGIAFLLGSDFFAAYDTELDLGHNAIRLFQPSGCKPEQLVYWNNGYFITKLTTPAADQPHVGFAVQLNGDRLSAWLSTSTPISTVTKLAAQSLGLKLGSDTARLLSADLEHPFWDGRFDTLAVGNETIHGARLRVAELFGKATYKSTESMLPQRITDVPDMILGLDFLRAHRIMVLPNQHQMLFTYTGGAVFTAPATATASPAPKAAPSGEPSTPPAQY
jgi:gag-polyprotein putative aspartyl protease